MTAPTHPVPDPTSTAPIETDALVIGAGPVGLFQVFQLGLQDIRTQVVDAHAAPGGQPQALYPDKPIYDLPGIPMCTGAELTQRLWQQVQPFAPQCHWGQQVHSLTPLPDGRLAVGMQSASRTSTRFIARTVFIAAGVGAFVPKRLAVPGWADWEGRQLFHHPGPDLPLAGQRVLVVGGDQWALERAADLAEQAQPPSHLTLLHRRDHWDADTCTLQRIESLEAAGRLQRRVGQVQSLLSTSDRLNGVTLSLPDGGTDTLALDQVLVFLGLSPKLGPVADWGLAMARKQLHVEPGGCETSCPGVYAVGDVVTYPGKKKLLVCGFHEAVMAAFAAAQRLRPDAPVLLEYTSSSTRLQRLLGVL
ncbi:NAD(P)/FAD-dependent oxidoreductase [Hydrogenophaga soli]